MNEINNNDVFLHRKIILVLSIILLFFLIIASYAGIFIAQTYARNTPSFAAQGIGQDIINLFVVAPLLLYSSIFYYKDHKRAMFLWAGLIMYVLYSYVIYCFSQPFNSLFLVYCAVLGLAFYTFILFLLENFQKPIKDWYRKKFPINVVISFMLVISILFYFVWLSEVIPALIRNQIPQSIIENGVNTNPVHVLDISIILPALILTAILLFKNNEHGYFLAPILLIFLLMMALAIIGMIIAMQILGVPTDIGLSVIFIIIAILDALITTKVLITLKPK